MQEGIVISKDDIQAVLKENPLFDLLLQKAALLRELAALRAEIDGLMTHECPCNGCSCQADDGKGA